jgi:RNAse (barnase) inhibitor barstar
MAKPVFEIDGERFSSFTGFCDEISRVLIPGASWGRNLDAFNDILRGGFGTPEDGFVVRWRNSELSRQRLTLLAPSGRTYFEELVDILRSHGPGGAESESGVDLLLE